MHITAIILAGGKSSRMGKDKGLMPFKGKAMISHIIEELKKLDIPIIIISNNSEYTRFGHPVYPDLIKDKGPIGGIYTGLLHSQTNMNLIVSCDTPLLTSQILNSLIKNHHDKLITLAAYQGKIHPTIGIFNKSILVELKKHIETGKLKLLDAFKPFQPNILNIEQLGIEATELQFTNINTVEEFNQYTQ